MALSDDLNAQVARIFRDTWEKRDGNVVPEPTALKLANDAVELDGTVLYADLTESTSLVDNHDPQFAAEVYKAYLHCAAKIILSEGGVITAYDGDRIMAVFLGGNKNTCAVRSGLKIHWAVRSIVNPAIKVQYPKSTYQVLQTVGIDTSRLFVARTGVRGSNDLVWVGRAANYAAKLTDLSSDYPTRITKAVFDVIHHSLKVTNGRDMWEPRTWNAMNGIDIYRSNWWIPF